MSRILSVLDPNRMGRIPFNAFLDFMTREAGDADTVEQMIESFKILAGGKVSILKFKNFQILLLKVFRKVYFTSTTLTDTLSFSLI